MPEPDPKPVTIKAQPEDSADGKLRAIWFEKGRKAVLRRNKSGCCCEFNEQDEIVSLCGAHQEYFEKLNHG